MYYSYPKIGTKNTHHGTLPMLLNDTTHFTAHRNMAVDEEVVSGNRLFRYRLIRLLCSQVYPSHERFG